MYKCLYYFLEMNSVIYDFQFGLQQTYSTYCALVHLTDKIRKLIYLQKTFGTVDHDILIQKLNHCGIRGVVKMDCNMLPEMVSTTRCCAPEGSILGLLLFLFILTHLLPIHPFSTP